MVTFEKNPSARIERDPVPNTLKIYYDKEKETIERIDQESTQKESILIYPIPLEATILDSDPEFENYIPDFKELSITGCASKDDLGTFFTIDPKEFSDELKKLVKEQYERRFLDFLERNMPEEEYIRFVIEQLAVNSYMPEEKAREDSSRIIIDWPEYYPRKTEIQKQHAFLSTTHPYWEAYHMNKLLSICTDPENYSYTEQYFEEDAITVSSSILYYIIELKNDRVRTSSMIDKLLEYYNPERDDILEEMKSYTEDWRYILEYQRYIDHRKKLLKESQKN